MEQGKKPKRRRRSYTEEFKAKAVQLVWSSGKTVSEVARDLDLTIPALRSWVKQAEIDAGTVYRARHRRARQSAR